MSVSAKNGMQLYRVEVEEARHATLWVLAESEAAARADAEELSTALVDDSWTQVETDLVVVPAMSEPPVDTPVWTGGPEGVDMQWRSLRG